MKKILFIVLVIVLSISCDNDNSVISSIDGVWIETIHKKDTLVFDNQFSGFILKRGTEIRNGYLLPKYLSGPYEYEIENDSISLRWGASSSSYATNYYFNLDLKNKEINIGNFFDNSINAPAIMTFKKGK